MNNRNKNTPLPKEDTNFLEDENSLKTGNTYSKNSAHLDSHKYISSVFPKIENTLDCSERIDTLDEKAIVYDDVKPSLAETNLYNFAAPNKLELPHSNLIPFKHIILGKGTWKPFQIEYKPDPQGWGTLASFSSHY